MSKFFKPLTLMRKEIEHKMNILMDSMKLILLNASFDFMYFRPMKRFFPMTRSYQVL